MRRTRSLVFGAAAVISAATLAACNNGQGVAVAAPPAAAKSTSAAPATSASASAPASAAPTKSSSKKAKTPATSDLTELKRAGIGLGEGVLLDVADDGEDLFLQIGENGAVDFTGTTRTDTTMMSLQPAAVPARNRVVIKPPFWNEDLGDGYCVADTAGAPLKLEICKPGKASQTWRVALAGDSGQFELHGAYGVIRVDGKITAGESGRTGLQTLPFAP